VGELLLSELHNYLSNYCLTTATTLGSDRDVAVPWVLAAAKSRGNKSFERGIFIPPGMRYHD
jgi:hypothetical protein